MSGVVVIGGGGHAKVVISTLRAAGYDPAAVLDDDITRKGEQLLGVPVLGTTDELRGSEFEGAVIAIGNNAVREKVAGRISLRWLTVVHPNAYVHESVRLGVGSVVFAHAVVQPDSRIGEHVIVNTSSSIDHDCDIGDFAHIAPGVRLAGGVRVGKGSLVGIGSAAIPRLTIGSGVIIGAGSILVCDIPAGAMAYGNPARVQHGTGARKA